MAISIASLSGDDDRSGDSGDDRGGVSNGSVPAKAASTLLTISLAPSIDELQRKKKIVKISHPANGKNSFKIYRNSSTLGAGVKYPCCLITASGS